MTVIVTGAAPLLAGEAHPVCLTHHHECDQTAAIRPCCCGDSDHSSNQGGPVELQVRIKAPLAPVVADLTSPPSPETCSFLARTRAFASRAAPPDLPTRFASLLI